MVHPAKRQWATQRDRHACCHSHLRPIIEPVCMSECGRKPEYPEETHKRTKENMQPQTGQNEPLDLPAVRWVGCVVVCEVGRLCVWERSPPLSPCPKHDISDNIHFHYEYVPSLGSEHHLIGCMLEKKAAVLGTRNQHPAGDGVGGLWSLDSLTVDSSSQLLPT